MNLQEYNKLKDGVRVLEEKAAKAEGAYEQELSRLRAEYGVDLEGAAKLLETMRAELDAAQARADEAKTKYLEKWGDKL